jgi:hypothetical protein
MIYLGFIKPIPEDEEEGSSGRPKQVKSEKGD